MRPYLYPSHLCQPPQVLSTRLFHLPTAGRSDISSNVRPPPCLLPKKGQAAASSQIARGLGFLIILLTVHLSDKTGGRESERERPPASLSFNGQPRNEREAIKAGAEAESLFNVSDRPDRIINQELKEFKTFALGSLT